MKSEFELQMERIFAETKSKGVVPLQDYFSWGRDKRHTVDDSEDRKFNSKLTIKEYLTSPLRAGKQMIRRVISKIVLSRRFKRNFIPREYLQFEETFNLMHDDESKKVFCEIILTRIYGEGRVHISTFTQAFIDSYEVASKNILGSVNALPVYKWILRKVVPSDAKVSLYTVPTVLNLIESGRLYRYEKNNKTIEVEAGDIVIDAGVGWGDTCVYLAHRCNRGMNGLLYAFDILPTAFSALEDQLNINPDIKNITPVHKALLDRDDMKVYITEPGPGARVVDYRTENAVNTISIDTFVLEHNLPTVNFIKMDIEGAEIPALKGAQSTIINFKPKLAISAYHLWDDLLEIPKLINSIRDDYTFYLDCTTGFGGEAVLYCA